MVIPPACGRSSSSAAPPSLLIRPCSAVLAAVEGGLGVLFSSYIYGLSNH